MFRLMLAVLKRETSLTEHSSSFSLDHVATTYIAAYFATRRLALPPR